MSNNPVDKGAGGISPFRTAGRWFTFLIFFLFVWVGLYLYTHQQSVRTGYQVTQFSSAHIDQLNRILYNASIPVAQAPLIKDTARQAGDTSSSDSTKAIAASQQPTYIMVCDDSCKINKALLYVRTEFDGKLQKEEETVIKDYIKTYSAQEVGSLLAQLQLKVSSYFWLSGPWMYLEMMFWVIFGVICSNLFSLGNLGRTRGFAAFDSKEVPYQIAKFFYAPFCAIIIMLGYNYVKHNEVVEVNATEGMIVVAFIIGLFSGRMMSFLERFKDALLPENVRSSEDVPRKVTSRQAVSTEEKNFETVVVKPKQVNTEAVKEPIIKEEVSVPVINDLYKEADLSIKEAEAMQALTTSMAFIAEEPLIEEEEESEVSATETVIPIKPIPQVVVMLNLDTTGLYEEEKNEVLDVGFINAVVTMHNVNGRDIVTARKSDDKYTASFVAPDVKPGIYIVRCTLTQKLSDDYIINLFGEKTVYITNENTVIDLFIKKYEAID
jgi:hypothetical protein